MSLCLPPSRPPLSLYPSLPPLLNVGRLGPQGLRCASFVCAAVPQLFLQVFFFLLAQHSSPPVWNGGLDCEIPHSDRGTPDRWLRTMSPSRYRRRSSRSADDTAGEQSTRPFRPQVEVSAASPWKSSPRVLEGFRMCQVWLCE